MSRPEPPCSAPCAPASPPWRPPWRGLRAQAATILLAPASPPSRWRWAPWCCLLTLLTGCASPPAPPIIPPAIPANLAQPCDPGPAIPDDDVTLAEALEVWAARELAAAECRDRVLRLQRAWPR